MKLGKYVGKYIGVNACGFINGHVYEIELDNNKRTYSVEASIDHTENKDVKLFMRYESETSIRRNWELED